MCAWKECQPCSRFRVGRDNYIGAHRPTPGTHHARALAERAFPTARVVFKLRIVLVNALLAPGQRQYGKVLTEIYFVFVLRSSLELSRKAVGMDFLVIPVA